MFNFIEIVQVTLVYPMRNSQATGDRRPLHEMPLKLVVKLSASTFINI